MFIFDIVMDNDEFDIYRDDAYERALIGGIFDVKICLHLVSQEMISDSEADAIEENAGFAAESAESKTVDTTMSDDRKVFIATIALIDCKQASQFKAAVEIPPKINGAMGQGKTNVRILKVLKETGILKDTFKKKSVAQFSILLIKKSLLVRH